MPKTVSTSQKSVTPSVGSFRPELQGLRALAVGLVLLFHLWPGRLSGGFVGVDVFFVISGFLITGHLYRELATTGTIKVTKFWARRVMRLLPLAFTVILFSLIALIFLLPETTWNMNVRQIIASLLYIENWILAADSVDYMASENEPSLVQHYWSLSIEEQFYFVLPLVFLGVLFIYKWLPRTNGFSVDATRRFMAWTLVLVFFVSFAFSVLYTDYQPAQAYFITPTRLWEFAIGGLLGLTSASSKFSPRLQNIIGWTGILMIVASAIIYTGDTPFPGYTALLPVIGTALFLRYGSYSPGTGIYWWSSIKPVVRMGDWSYAIYLWHWPLIIIAGYLLDDFFWPQKIVVILLTFVLAALSQRLVEDPLRHAKYFKIPKRAFASMAVVVVLLTGATALSPTIFATDVNDNIAVDECSGANAFFNNCKDFGLEGTPLISPAQVESEKSNHPFPECFIPSGVTDFDRSDCSLGADESSADLTVAIFGSSHARMWLPMLDEVGQRQNWNIQGYTKSACSPVPLSKVEPSDTGAERADNEACDQFVLDTAKAIAADPSIDVVATASLGAGGNFYHSNGALATHDEKIEALDSMWQSWIDSGKKVIAFGEVPLFDDIEAPTCVESNFDVVADNCSVDFDKGVTSRGVYQRFTALEGESDTLLYDPTKGMCDSDRCYSMVGNMITRYDRHHLSQDFAISYTDDFAKFMREKVLSE